MLISLEARPIRSKTSELSFGQLFHHDEEYSTLPVLAGELRLDQTQVDIHQAFGLASIVSYVSYFQAAVAAAQAHALWYRSLIAKQYQAGKLVWAQYGVQEVETRYTTWLGGCADAAHGWPAEVSRTEYLAEQALRATLLHACDLDGFRAHLQLASEHYSDAQLLRLLHRERARAAAIPAAARAESEQWLRGHATGRHVQG